MPEYSHEKRVGAGVARLRAEAGVTQSVLAEKSGFDQSKISRVEKGDIVASDDVDRVLDALDALGAPKAREYKEYVGRDWRFVEPPAFWNPERACVEIAEETLGEIDSFLADPDRPWPLRRQVERHREALERAATHLSRTDHNIAFIGEMGVGKSTAISFIFDLLIPVSLADKAINRPVLETGAGGTTICEVHIKGGPEFGISLVPMGDAEMREIVSDFCAARWMVLHGGESRDTSETAQISRETERAIRNMSGLGRTRSTVDGKPVYTDPLVELARASTSEDEFRTLVLSKIDLEQRTQHQLWYDSSTRKHPMEWVTETFKAVNNGRLPNVPLPKSIDLLIPDFGKSFGELEITVIDTKGVDDVAVREDLDHRLKDPRTAVVFCSRFNDAPGTSTRLLLQHMRQTFSERFDAGKVAVLALPRSDEALAMKDDAGEQALTDEEGYQFKELQVSSELAADDLPGVPMLFYNVQADSPETARTALFGQLARMRKGVEDRLFDLCAAAQDIIKNHEEQALNAALEEVSNRLNSFLKGNRPLGAREHLAHADLIQTVLGVRHASTLWASTRRNGDYWGLNAMHLVGVGAARDARLRSESWFTRLDGFLKTLQADEGLILATNSIKQIAASAADSKRAFLEAAQLAGVEVYRGPLSQSQVWTACASEWGRGPGFKNRVANHLTGWFNNEADLKQRLDQLITGLWEQLVIAPLLRLAEEHSAEA